VTAAAAAPATAAAMVLRRRSPWTRDSDTAAHAIVVRSETVSQTEEGKHEESTATQMPPALNVTEALLGELNAMMGFSAANRMIYSLNHSVFLYQLVVGCLSIYQKFCEWIPHDLR
jgi:DNA-binding XRE family transcriptional regulator